MKKRVDELKIDGVTYVPKGSEVSEPDGDYVVVRTYSAGVHAGYLDSRDGQEVVLKQTRRLWKWDGAATLSQVAGKGISKPKSCKFPAPIAEITLTQAIEIIPCTKDAREIIEGAPEWTS